MEDKVLAEEEEAVEEEDDDDEPNELYVYDHTVSISDHEVIVLCSIG